MGGFSVYAATAAPQPDAHATARITAVVSGSLLLAAATGEICAQRYAVHRKNKKLKTRWAVLCAVVKDVLSIRPWKTLGADIAAVARPLPKNADKKTNRFAVFYKKHRVLSWATCIATVYTAGTWIQYARAQYAYAAAEAERLKQAEDASAAKKLDDERIAREAAAKADAKRIEREKAEQAEVLRRKAEAEAKLKADVAAAQAETLKKQQFKAEVDAMRERLAAADAKRKTTETPADKLELFYGTKKVTFDPTYMRTVNTHAELPNQADLSTHQRGLKAGYYFVKESDEYWLISCVSAEKNILLSTFPTTTPLEAPTL